MTILVEDHAAQPGTMLRVAREKKGLTLADVSRVTKIKESVLRLLEADAFSDLPAQVFVIGFMKAHARVVGADPDQVVAAYRRTQASPALLGPGFEVAPAPLPVGDSPAGSNAVTGSDAPLVESSLLAALDKRRVGVALMVLLFIVVITLTLSAILSHTTPGGAIS